MAVIVRPVVLTYRVMSAPIHHRTSPPLRRRAQPPRDPRRRRSPGDGRRHRRALDRRPRQGHRNEQERPLRALRVEGGAPACDHRRRRGGVRRRRHRAGDAERRWPPRVEALCERFLSHVERGVFPGGCFFASVAAELDTRPGPVRDRITAFQSGWAELIAASLQRGPAPGRPRAKTRASSSSLSSSTRCSDMPTRCSCFRATARCSTWHAARSATASSGPELEILRLHERNELGAAGRELHQLPSSTSVAKAAVGNFVLARASPAPPRAMQMARSWIPGLWPITIADLTGSGTAQQLEEIRRRAA